MNPEVRALLKELRKSGAVIDSRHRHHKVFVKGRCVGVIPKTPSDHRSIKNNIAALRRAGILIRKS